MKLPTLWNRRQIHDINVVPDWYVILGMVDASNYDVTYCFEEFFVVGATALKSHNQRFIVVGDIWLSNRSYLLKLLHIYKKYTDKEIIAHLWEIKGEECLNLLEGMFSLCVWDNQEKRLYLVRDGVGCHTLYYIYSGKSCVIAPRLATLLPFHSQQLNLVALRGISKTDQNLNIANQWALNSNLAAGNQLFTRAFYTNILGKLTYF